MTNKCHENSGGYACVQYSLLYIVMCVILHVAAYLLSVNLLHMYTVCCVAPTFSFEGIKNFFT